jgi:hypothetical protein
MPRTFSRPADATLRRFVFRFVHKQKQLAFGAYPTVTF